MGDIADLYDYALWPEDFDDQPATCLYCRADIVWEQDQHGSYKPYTPGGKRHLCKPFLESTRPDINEIFKPIK